MNPSWNAAQIFYGLLSASIIGGIAMRLKVLSKSGALATLLIGTIVFGIGGFLFAVPIIFFFISSGILSAIKTSRKREALKNLGKGGPRDWVQVLANGGVGAICTIGFGITGNPLWYFLYLGSIAEACADTWATEIGSLSKTEPVSIINFKKMEAGFSGGVTALGTMAGIIGAASTIVVSLVFNRILFAEIGKIDPIIWIAILNAGIAGSILDSIIGGSIQGLFFCTVCKKHTEQHVHCSRRSQLIKGHGLINNDMVNFICTLFAVIILALYFVIQ